MQKDKIIDGLFKAAIIITTLIGIIVAFIGMSFVETGGDALVMLVVGLAFVFIVIPIYIAEFDLYYDIKYFIKNQDDKVRWKTVFNVISAMLSVLVLLSVSMAVAIEVLSLTAWGRAELFIAIMKSVFSCYIIVRVLYLLMSWRYKRKNPNMTNN